jgi:hypothetical protein
MSMVQFPPDVIAETGPFNNKNHAARRFLKPKLNPYAIFLFEQPSLRVSHTMSKLFFNANHYPKLKSHGRDIWVSHLSHWGFSTLAFKLIEPF